MKFTCDANVLVDVLRSPAAEEAFGVFLSRFSHVTYLSAIVMLELRAGARSAAQARLLDKEIFQRFDRAKRVITLSAAAFTTAGALLASLATREGWTAAAHPSLVHDALLAASCRESGVVLITRDRDFARLKTVLRGWRFVAPWPGVNRGRKTTNRPAALTLGCAARNADRLNQNSGDRARSDLVGRSSRSIETS